MSRPRIWVTGAAGLIGHELVQIAGNVVPGFEVLPITRSEVDLTDFEAVARRFQADSPNLIIHCAGLTRSPACEADPDLAHRLNVEVTRHLVDLARTSVILFFSSDLVFDGDRGNYTELDEPRPLSAYGRSKVAAEHEVLRDPRHVVLRTSLNYGHSRSGDRSFNEEMALAARQGRTLRLFTDEFRCPIAAAVTARATWELTRAILAPAAQPPPTGIFHLAGSERLSRWQIGELLATVHPELQHRIEPSSRRDYSGPPRPADTSMNCSKIAAYLSFPLPRFSDWLRAYRVHGS